jgi:asparagine synthase (glutamine-hydrolysing)
MFLSGGIDSSAIAALMARNDRPAAPDVLGRLQASARSASWTTRARSRRPSADAHEIVIDDHDFFGALPRLIWHEDEPIAHPSSVPLYFVSALARST